MPRRRMPTVILIFFIIDVALVMAYSFNYLADRPYRWVTRFLDLNRESNLPTWYSSMQWFCVAALLGLFAQRNFSPAQRKSWFLMILPWLFLALSLDEVALIHESLGHASDSLLPGASRTGTVFSRTGIWMFVIGMPFLAFFVGLILSIRTYFQRAPGALVKILLGMAIMLGGAIGIEIFMNVVTPGSGYAALQVLSEELGEMLGSTIVLWGSYELLDRHGFAVQLDRTKSDQSAPWRSNSG